MQRAKYTSECKEEAVRQVVDKGHSVVDFDKGHGESSPDSADQRVL
jgi:transposase-like protein